MTASSVDTADSDDRPLHSPVSPSTALSSVDENENSPPLQTNPASSALDDIFGSSPPSVADYARDQNADISPSHAEPSDLPSLRRQHVTAGYRDGVAVAKGEHVQRGFDKGFPVGAEVGIRAGVVLGVLEGLVKSLSSKEKQATTATSSTANEGKTTTSKEDVTALYETAKKELVVEKVFGAAASEDLEYEKEEDRDDPCVRLGKVGDAVVTRWEDRVRILLADLS